MKLIKDLGVILPPSGIGNKTRFGIYECPFCEEPFKTRTSDVRSLKSTKCKKCARSTHGEHDSRLYKIFYNMKNRCNLESMINYKDYGGRGITVCQEWQDSFEAFRDWAMANGYEEHLTIDRKDNDGNYEPDNCRWVTQTVQSRNTRKLHKDNTLGYRGIRISKNKKRFCARINVDKKEVYLGTFDTKREAGIAYDSYITENNLEHTRNFK